jgi:uncharacterized protein YqgC (DUF456 family)
MPWWGDVLVALCLVVAITGTVIPVLPGALLAGAAVFVWALIEGGSLAWTVFILVLAVLLVGQIARYLIPGRALRNDDLPWWVIVGASVLGIIGFFLVPVVGLPLFFILGIWLGVVIEGGAIAGSGQRAMTALKAVGIGILIEAGSVLLATGLWLTGLVVAAL